MVLERNRIVVGRRDSSAIVLDLNEVEALVLEADILAKCQFGVNAGLRQSGWRTHLCCLHQHLCYFQQVL